MRYYQVEISVNKMKSILQILPKQIVLFFHYVCPSVCMYVHHSKNDPQIQFPKKIDQEDKCRV